MGEGEFEDLKNTIVDKFNNEYVSERIGNGASDVAAINVAVDKMNL